MRIIRTKGAEIFFSPVTPVVSRKLGTCYHRALPRRSRMQREQRGCYRPVSNGRMPLGFGCAGATISNLRFLCCCDTVTISRVLGLRTLCGLLAYAYAEKSSRSRHVGGVELASFQNESCRKRIETSLRAPSPTRLVQGSSIRHP